jgi:hypothetical protein
MTSNQINRGKFLAQVQRDILNGSIEVMMTGIGAESTDALFNAARITGAVDTLIEIDRQVRAGSFDVAQPEPAPHAAEIAEETANVIAGLRTYFDDRTPKTYSARVIALNEVREAFERLSSYTSPNTTPESVEVYRSQAPTFPAVVSFDEASSGLVEDDNTLDRDSEDDYNDRDDDEDDYDSDDGDDEDDDRGEDLQQINAAAAQADRDLPLCGENFDEDYVDEPSVERSRW